MTLFMDPVVVTPADVTTLVMDPVTVIGTYHSLAEVLAVCLLGALASLSVCIVAVSIVMLAVDVISPYLSKEPEWFVARLDRQRVRVPEKVVHVVQWEEFVQK
jgi:hypothetical protein